MGGYFEETPYVQSPITDEPAEAVGAEAGYIEQEIRRIDAFFEGEERIFRLLDFFSLSLAEIYLTHGFKPGVIRSEADDKARLLRGLAPGILPPLNRDCDP